MNITITITYLQVLCSRTIPRVHELMAVILTIRDTYSLQESAEHHRFVASCHLQSPSRGEALVPISQMSRWLTSWSSRGVCSKTFMEDLGLEPMCFPWSPQSFWVPGSVLKKRGGQQSQLATLFRPMQMSLSLKKKESGLGLIGRHLVRSGIWGGQSGLVTAVGIHMRYGWLYEVTFVCLIAWCERKQLCNIPMQSGSSAWLQLEMALLLWSLVLLEGTEVFTSNPIITKGFSLMPSAYWAAFKNLLQQIQMVSDLGSCV